MYQRLRTLTRHLRKQAKGQALNGIRSKIFGMGLNKLKIDANILPKTESVDQDIPGRQDRRQYARQENIKPVS